MKPQLDFKRKAVIFGKQKKTFSEVQERVAMPIYEFECEQCHQRFERLILPSENRKPPCPKCNGENIRKLMSACRNVTLKIPAGYGGGAKPPACTPGG
jgi:putative FmdB family regulatory protein